MCSTIKTQLTNFSFQVLRKSIIFSSFLDSTATFFKLNGETSFWERSLWIEHVFLPYRRRDFLDAFLKKRMTPAIRKMEKIERC